MLADALWYCQDRFKPQVMIDLATLTGAIMIALGTEHAGLFSNNDESRQRSCSAAARRPASCCGACRWAMPTTR